MGAPVRDEARHEKTAEMRARRRGEICGAKIGRRGKLETGERDTRREK